MITVIAPHGRPEFSANLLANFRRQRGVEARMVVVENGPVLAPPLPAKPSSSDGAPDTDQLGGSRRCGVTPNVTAICSEHHQADAMNAGLEWLRANGGGPWARFDDDDYYGSGYLAAVERSFLLGESELGCVVSGMPWRFVMLDDGLYKFTSESEIFTGGSLAASSADVATFERFRDDDVRWCRAMRAQGATFVEREPWGYCYDRTTRLAPRVVEGGSAVSRFGFGPSLFYGSLALSAVDDPAILPLCNTGRPTDAELMAEMSG